MLTSYTPAETKEMLMKPVRLTGLFNEIIALEDANVISSTTGAAVANLIFNEINADTSVCRSEWLGMISDIKDQSRHLYQTTDELNANLHKYVNPSSDMSTYTIRVEQINEVYDLIKHKLLNLQNCELIFLKLQSNLLIVQNIKKQYIYQIQCM